MTDPSDNTTFLYQTRGRFHSDAVLRATQIKRTASESESELESESESELESDTSHPVDIKASNRSHDSAAGEARETILLLCI